MANFCEERLEKASIPQRKNIADSLNELNGLIDLNCEKSKSILDFICGENREPKYDQSGAGMVGHVNFLIQEEKTISENLSLIAEIIGMH